MSIEEQVEVAESNLERILEWVGRFDSKCSIVLGIDTGMLGVLAAISPRISTWTTEVTAFAAAALVLVAGSLVFACIGAFPRTKGPTGSPLFFASIAKTDFAEYAREFRGQTAEKYLHIVLEQCHRNSRIIDRKFWSLKWAYGLLFASVVPWAVAIYMFNPSGIGK